jgi:hypothetical protein
MHLADGAATAVVPPQRGYSHSRYQRPSTRIDINHAEHGGGDVE